MENELDNIELESPCDTGSDDLAFVNRTRELVKQYMMFVHSERDAGRKIISYSRTLFVNCCMGLLIIPKTRLKRDDMLFSQQAEKWGIDVSRFEYREKKLKMKDLVTHLRNSLAHNHAEFIFNKKREMESIRFSDYEDDDCEKMTFRGELSYKDFETLVYLLADYILESSE